MSLLIFPMSLLVKSKWEIGQKRRETGCRGWGRVRGVSAAVPRGKENGKNGAADSVIFKTIVKNLSFFGSTLAFLKEKS